MEEEDLKYLLLSFADKKEVTKEVIEIIKKKYYGRREKMQNYKETKKRLVQLIIEGNFPNSKQWNKIARKRRVVLKHIYTIHRKYELETNSNQIN